MRLIRITEKKEVYLIDAEASLKLLGIRVWSRLRVFQKKKGRGDWIELPQKKIPSKIDRKKLDYWLLNHKKYVSPPI